MNNEEKKPLSNESEPENSPSANEASSPESKTGSGFLSSLSKNAKIAIIAAVGCVAVAVVAVAITVSVITEIVKEIKDLDVEEQAEETDNSHKGEYTVYSLLDPKTQEVRYVGRTKNYDARIEQHNRPGSKTYGLKRGPTIDNLTYSQARGIEQFGIWSYNTIDLGKNSINGVSDKNKNRLVYFKVAYDYLYNQLSNEWYNMFGR